MDLQARLRAELDDESRAIANVAVTPEYEKAVLAHGDLGSSSMAVMLAITDALALALLEVRGISNEDWGLRHHGGYLGRKARMDNEPH